MPDIKKPVIAVCMPMARGVHPATMRSLLGADIPRPWHLFDPVGYQVDNARNMITQDACNTEDVTHLLWVDDDMTFSRDAVQRLLAHDLPIVGGLCHNRRHPYMPILVHFTERGFSFQYDYPEGLIEVDATGAAFLLTKKEVYFKIREQFAEGPWTVLHTGEDISFCQRARAAGYKIMVDTTVKIGHMGEIEVNEDFAKRNRQFKANPWFPRQPMPAGSPVASIIIPTYNQRPEWLKAAVASALTQTVPVEVIVVDDGSDVPVVLSDLEANPSPFGGPDAVRLIRIEHAGPWAALNAGIRAMTTNWFCWLSSDDLLYPPKVEQQMAAMEREGAIASFHGYDTMLGGGGIARTVVVPSLWNSMREQQAALRQGCGINGLTVMLHRDVFDEVGLFDESYTISSDWHFWNKVARVTRWLSVNEVLATRRESEENASTKYAADPVKRAIWQAEDARIRQEFAREED